MRKQSVITALTTMILLFISAGVRAELSPIPDTGQTQCYNNSRAVNCSGPGGYFYGQDAHYDVDAESLGSDQERYTRVREGEDETVQDNITGLVWEVKTAQNYDIRYTWDEALAFVDSLNQEGFGGYTDWRLPEIRELAFILDRGRYAPAISDEFRFDGEPEYSRDKGEDLYWSSTSEPDDPDTEDDESLRIFYADLYGGNISSFSYTEPGADDPNYAMNFYKRYVRAVRGETFRSEFRDNRDGTVTDMSTGLMWQTQEADDPAIGQLMGWKQALEYCEKVNDPEQKPRLGGYTDWRLPNINELFTLADHEKREPAKDNGIFSVTGSSPSYWSGTTRTKDNAHAWSVNFNKGTIGYISKGNENFVRLVRGGVNEPIQDVGEGYDVTPDLRINALIYTVEKGRIQAVWQKGGQDTTARGDKVLWGHFFASPDDVSWGSQENPDLFVKIWFDANGRVDVNFFHVSVPDIQVWSEYQGEIYEYGLTTLETRYIRHWYEDDQSGSEKRTEDGLPLADDSPQGDPSGYLIDDLRIGAIIQTEEKGPVDAIWRLGGEDLTARGDNVVWGHFYADPDDVTWGSPDNPDLFVKIWFDVTGRADVNFFHVSVPEIEVYSVLPDDSSYHQKGTTVMDNRYIRHEYQR